MEKKPVYESPKVSGLDEKEFAHGGEPSTCRPGSSAVECRDGAGGTDVR